MSLDIRLTYKLDTDNTRVEAELAEAIENYLQKCYLPHEVTIRKPADEMQFIIQVDLAGYSLSSIDREKAFLDGMVYAFRWMSVFQIANDIESEVEE